MSIELKIKSKHLAEEAKIIRFEERKLLKQVAYKRNKHKETGSNDVYNTSEDSNFSKYKSLSNHRRFDVRNENRATFLARAYLADKPYNTIEQSRREDREYNFQTYVVPRIIDMVMKYGPYRAKADAIKEVTDWLSQ